MFHISITPFLFSSARSKSCVLTLNFVALLAYCRRFAEKKIALPQALSLPFKALAAAYSVQCFIHSDGEAAATALKSFVSLAAHSAKSPPSDSLR